MQFYFSLDEAYNLYLYIQVKRHTDQDLFHGRWRVNFLFCELFMSTVIRSSMFLEQSTLI